MAREERSMAPMYFALGALAAVGAGYLLWRFGLPEETKERTRAAMLNGVEKAKATMLDQAMRAREAMNPPVGR